MNNICKTFKEFIKDYRNYYNEKVVRVVDESEMQEVCYDLYNTENFEIDYEAKTIELFY